MEGGKVIEIAKVFTIRRFSSKRHYFYFFLDRILLTFVGNFVEMIFLYKCNHLTIVSDRIYVIGTII